ncbi:MAG: TMEM165/GDT1 family protein [Candidatus Omnitrophica bacterium]|nr:TMEM165/GDT1 family protein [Candidatus Omnitrophota bacterium]
MDWKIFFATFSAIFLAELGDKTQLANLCMAAKSKSWISVVLASIAAFSLVTLITVLLGGVFKKFLNPEHIRYIAAALFIGVGLLMLLGKI